MGLALKDEKADKKIDLSSYPFW